MAETEKETEKIKSGDVVQLKSGGPKMTTGAWYGNSATQIYCYWFVDEDMKNAVLSTYSLIKAN